MDISRGKLCWNCGIFFFCTEKFNDWVLSSGKNLFKCKRSRLGSQPNKLTKDSMFKIIDWSTHYNMKGVNTQFCLLSFTKYRDDLNEYFWAYFNMPWGNSASRICFSNVRNSHSYCILRGKKSTKIEVHRNMSFYTGKVPMFWVKLKISLFSTL